MNYLSIVFTVCAFAAQVPATAPPAVSIASTLDWFRTQHPSAVFADLGGSLVRVELAPASNKGGTDMLYLTSLARPTGVAGKLGVDSPELAAIFAKAEHAQLVIKSCGPVFGDDECDSYGPVNQTVLIGNKIDEKARQHYLQLLGELRAALTPAPPTGLRIIR